MKTLKALYYSDYLLFNIKDISKWEKYRIVTMSNKKQQNNSREIARKLIKYHHDI